MLTTSVSGTLVGLYICELNFYFQFLCVSRAVVGFAVGMLHDSAIAVGVAQLNDLYYGAAFESHAFLCTVLCTHAGGNILS